MYSIVELNRYNGINPVSIPIIFDDIIVKNSVNIQMIRLLASDNYFGKEQIHLAYISLSVALII